MNPHRRFILAAHAPKPPKWFEPRMVDSCPAEVLPDDPRLRDELIDGGIAGETQFPSPELAAWLAATEVDREAWVIEQSEWRTERSRQVVAQWPWAYADLVLGAQTGRTRTVVEIVTEAVALSLSPMHLDGRPMIRVRSPRSGLDRAVEVVATDAMENLEQVDVICDAVVDSVVEALAIAGLVHHEAARRNVDLNRRMREQDRERADAAALDDEGSPDNFREPSDHMGGSEVH